MKNRLLRFVTVLTLSGMALSLTVCAIALDPQQAGQAVQRDGAKRQTLRDIARDRDIEVEGSEEKNSAEYSDLRLLTKHAEAIVVGRVIKEESSFDGDDHIITAYRLDVQRVLKHTKLHAPLGVGNEPPAALVTPLKFVRPSGIVLVNGHRASRKLKSSEAIQPSSDVLLFLWWSPAYKAYTLAGGVSGAFLIDGDLRLRPLASKRGMLEYGGTLEAVIDEVWRLSKLPHSTGGLLMHRNIEFFPL
jgi:hypothetical protein